MACLNVAAIGICTFVRRLLLRARVEQRSELRVHLENCLLLRYSAGRQAFFSNTVGDFDTGV